MTASPAERRMQARAAIHTRWAKTPHPDDRAAATSAAREAVLRNLEREVDPDQKLNPARRRDAALQLQRARLINMNRQRAQKARRRKEREDRSAAT